MHENLICWFNGTFQSLGSVKISPLDFGFIHNDATYDVFRVINGKPFFLNLHEERFKKSCNYFGFSSIENLDKLSIELCNMNNLENVFVWVCVWRGQPPTGSPRDLNGPQNSLIYIKPYYELSQSPFISLTINANHRRVPDACYNQSFKNFGWIEFTFAQREADRLGFDSSLLQSPDGYITEGPGFGVCFVNKGQVRTPKNHCLHSVTLQIVEDLCNKMKIPFERCDISLEDAYCADEAFVGSTSGGITLVSKLDHHEFSHDLSKKIKEAFNGIKI
jgi:branched-chain amino acid aminotransferase